MIIMSDDTVTQCLNCGAIVLQTTKHGQCPHCHVRLDVDPRTGRLRTVPDVGGYQQSSIADWKKS